MKATTWSQREKFLQLVAKEYVELDLATFGVETDHKHDLTLYLNYGV
jgi:hypothetical protein